MVSIKHPNDPSNETRLTLKSECLIYGNSCKTSNLAEESPLIRITKRLVLEGGGAEGERAVDV